MGGRQWAAEEVALSFCTMLAAHFAKLLQIGIPETVRFGSDLIAPLAV